MLKPISTKQFVVTVEGQSFTLQSKKGGKVSRVTDTYIDPVEGTEYTHSSFTKRENITLTKLYEPDKDSALRTWLITQMDSPTPFNVSSQPVTVGLKSAPQGTAFIYNGCNVISYTDPEADRDGSGLAMWNIELSYDSTTSQ